MSLRAPAPPRYAFSCLCFGCYVFFVVLGHVLLLPGPDARKCGFNSPGALILSTTFPSLLNCTHACFSQMYGIIGMFVLCGTLSTMTGKLLFQCQVRLTVPDNYSPENLTRYHSGVFGLAWTFSPVLSTSPHS